MGIGLVICICIYCVICLKAIKDRHSYAPPYGIVVVNMFCCIVIC